MRYIGIDYGSKRVGVAISDEEGKLAFPKGVLPNNRYLFTEIKNLCSKEVGGIVLGESKDYQMKDNAIMEKIRRFKVELEQGIGIPVYFEPEFMTSHQASRFQQEKDLLLDARAAAIILQSFLDRQKNNIT